ncbi:MAG: bifunctional glutamate N-acetyltransferase/amino-acid acetyltransferase ArgJ [Anaerolineae bacterium]|nr:bifunctional glutamate N-acetyltransferase/amino-acid acetyltransferase ArgJ [Anaerolineae bacterium]MDW8173097.1 bifunctional glutamate N-acetyltransferase/amino-acid acetyltransferase ArgJ [Anaerolineae bacterium]
MFEVQGSIGAVRGFRVAGIHGGLKKSGAPDLALIVADRLCVAAGVFTRNLAKAAPILVSQEYLRTHAQTIRAVIVNTTCANALTGKKGMDDARQVTRLVADGLGLQAPQQVLPMSTGVIGTLLPMDKIASAIPQAISRLGQDWQAAAQAIMTTDTRPKMASVCVETAEGSYTIAGISKGAGMIAPNMATMLGIIATDAKISLPIAQRTLHTANEVSFNRIVVDGDTSTNDCVFLLANGASGVAIDKPSELALFERALTEVCVKLAQAIVRDGEGATKFITLRVIHAQDAASAAQIAHTIAASPLVKTAFFGQDANWGRIVAAAGRAGQPFDPDRAQLWIAPGESLPNSGHGLLLFKHGTVAKYSEADAAAIFREPSISVTLDCGVGGRGSAVVWTCDLSREYVDINADYRS